MRAQLKAYCSLLRLDKPVGTLLLWFPTAWALWLAHGGVPPLSLVLAFLGGTLLMRSAGCVFNDIADRQIDRGVARTQLRPLSSGLISLQEAFLLLFLLLAASLILVLHLPASCFYWALCALLISILYPFCKRFLKAPQMILGLAFSMGIPMAYVASIRSLDWEAGLLFLINFLWIVAYDTMYAMTDKEDDLRLGVHSTAIYFSSYDRLIIALLLLILHFLWLVWGLLQEVEPLFWGGWILALGLLGYQMKLINKRKPQDCFRAFKFSIYYGLTMWIAIGMALMK